MKFEIDLPDNIAAPLKRTAEGFGIRFERAVEIAVGEYVGAMDAQIALFGRSVTPHGQSFDAQFAEGHEGWTIESSCEASKANWLKYFVLHNEFFAEMTDFDEMTQPSAPCVSCAVPSTKLRSVKLTDGKAVPVPVCDKCAEKFDIDE